MPLTLYWLRNNFPFFLIHKIEMKATLSQKNSSAASFQMEPLKVHVLGLCINSEKVNFCQKPVSKFQRKLNILNFQNHFFQKQTNIPIYWLERKVISPLKG